MSPPTRLYAAPILLNGRCVVLINTPRCWCGRQMTGTASRFITDGPDINWLCDDHGNDGMTFEYVVNEKNDLCTVNALSSPNTGPKEGTE